jgi:hypothetical protein
MTRFYKSCKSKVSIRNIKQPHPVVGDDWKQLKQTYFGDHLNYSSRASRVINNEICYNRSLETDESMDSKLAQGSLIKFQKIQMWALNFNDRNLWFPNELRSLFKFLQENLFRIDCCSPINGLHLHMPSSPPRHTRR